VSELSFITCEKRAEGSSSPLRCCLFFSVNLISFSSFRFRYFASRPEILTKGNNNDNNNNGGQAAAALAASSSAAAANAVRNAVVKRPEQAAKYVTAGLKHFAGSSGTNAHGNNNNDSRLGTPSGSGGHNSNKGMTGGQGVSEVGWLVCFNGFSYISFYFLFPFPPLTLPFLSFRSGVSC